MFRFLILLAEAGTVRLGRQELYRRISTRVRAEIKYWYWRVIDFIQDTWQVLGEALSVFGRPPKVSHTFTWWTYYVAVTRALRHARMAKYSWGETIDAWVCCEFYYRYEDLQHRARERGYVKLASGGIHDSKGYTRKRLPNL